jgi:hypothetical protein
MSAVLGRGDLFASLLYAFPLFVIYGVGVLFTPSMNGVDFVTRNLYAALGYSVRNYLLAYVGMAIAFGGVLWWLRREGALSRQPFVGVIVEAAIVALTLGSFIVFVMHHLLHLGAMVPGGGPLLAARGGGLKGAGPGTSVILSLGAGVHEELVFRLGLFAGGTAVARLAGLRHGTAAWIMAFLSSAIFSAVHHLGPMGDPWSMNVFVYRWMAGLAFTALFYWRSLAHAVYAHAFYDLYVSLILG